MESALVKLLLLVASVSVAVCVVGFVWSMYSGLSRTAMFQVSDLQVFSDGSRWKVMFRLKNTGTVTVDWIRVEVYEGASSRGTYTWGSDIKPYCEQLCESPWRGSGVAPGDSLKVIIVVGFYGGQVVKQVFDVVALKW